MTLAAASTVMTASQRFALAWLFTATLAAGAITWAGEVVLDAFAVTAPR